MDKECWITDLGFKTKVSQLLDVDLNITQYNEFGELNIFHAYSNPGFHLFCRLLEYSKIIGNSVPEENIFAEYEHRLFGSGNAKSFDFFRDFSKTFSEYNLERDGVVYCGGGLSSAPFAYVGKIENNNFEITSNGRNKDRIVFSGNDLEKILGKIYQQYPSKMFIDIYNFVLKN